ncbi:MAG: class I SAM-dependent methyltransferase [Eubacteriales bacterium]|nr:class I SAM-dependent methyltransferase [Eubacteriales bacterium]
MYSKAFCKVYNEFGWNYFPQAFGEQLLKWIEQNQVTVRTSLDLACGTGILCEILSAHGIQASGMDFSEGMIAIARENHPEICYEVADMIQYCPDKRFDLVTCTGDALNHILDLEDVERIFRNVYAYLNEGGYFIFDILNEKEIPSEEPFELEFDEKTKAEFSVLRDARGRIHLRTKVFEEGKEEFEEEIVETVHEREAVCGMLRKCGFEVVRWADSLLEGDEAHGTTWFVIARKGGLNL